MKILLINNQFSIGGAARVASTQCNILYKKGVDLTVVTDNINWPVDYKLNPSIKILPIDISPKKSSSIGKVIKTISCIRRIRKYIKLIRPDAIISIQADMFLRSYIAKMGIKIPLLVADHTSFDRKQDRITNFVRYHLYAKADGISILTHKDENILSTKYPHKKVIYNPLTFAINHKSVERRKNILCVGRLDVWDVKGFDIIIDIWAKIQDLYPEWTLEIAGTGDEKSVNFIKSGICNLNISNRVKLLGQVLNIKDLYLESSIFALPSRTEGFPMALMEAMSQGCASVAFSVKGAADEMLRNAGKIVKDGDIHQFQKALQQLIEDKDLRDKLGKKALIEAARFSVDEFGNNWINFVDTTIKRYNQ